MPGNNSIFRRHGRPAPRRGMALVMVLGLIAITLAVSYAVLRNQATSVAIQTNADLRSSAQQAAQTGLAAAIRRMSNSDWAGVGTEFKVSLSRSESFHVAFEAGDSELTAGSADYAELPFRVTLVSTGTAADPGDERKTATHIARAVVQLVRRRFASDPSGWSTLQTYSLYQWNTSYANIQTPLQIQGNALLQATLALSADYPCDCEEPARVRYFQDLEALRAAGQPDWRPFTGKVFTPYSRNSTVVHTQLRGQLNVATQDIASSSSNPLAAQTVPTSYRVFAGGPVYTIPNVSTTIGQTWANVTLEADPATNPLGVFRSSTNITVNSNVTVRGTLLLASGCDLYLSGSNVKFGAPSLPTLDGGTTVRLPTLIIGDDLRVNAEAGAEIKGLCVVADDSEIRRGAASAVLDLRGQLITKDLATFGREPWYEISDWADPYEDFLDQLPVEGVPLAVGSALPITNFVTFLGNHHDLSSEPLLTIRPDSSGVATHWHTWTEPIYRAHANDSGLRWDVVRWEANP